MLQEIKEHYEIRRDGTIFSHKSNKYLSFGRTKRGRQTITLMMKDNTTKTFLVHRLVAFKFITNPNNLPQVNHIDGNIDNNHVDNLEWCTNDYNMAHAIENNLIPEQHFKTNPPKGELNKASILTNELVIELRNKKLTYKEFKKEYDFDITKACYNQMMRGYTWKHIAMGSVRPKQEKNPPLLQYTLDGAFIAEYQTITEAQEKSGANRAVIRKCCIGKSNTAGGYIWKYKV